MKTPLSLLILIFLASCTASRKTAQPGEELVPRLKAHITYLSSDELEGRRTGTKGEELAMEYIATAFRKLGLEPKGTESYVQSFLVNDGKMMSDVNRLEINDQELRRETDYFVYPFSPDALVNSRVAIALREVQSPWFYDLDDALEANKNNPHYDVNEFIKKAITDAAKDGATAVVFYNSSVLPDNQLFDPKDRSAVSAIPAIYVKYDAAKKYFADPSATMKFSLRTSIGEKTRTGRNVIGYIDNGAATTVVLGAHYDHLGYGEDGNSMIRTGERNIHNGADDNASGTAALIELGRILQSGPKGNNYLFIAFSGEELGLFGSKYFVENPTIDLSRVSYMVNLDMVGRVNDSTNTVTIGGIGTSPEWNSTVTGKLDIFYDGNTTQPRTLNIRVDSSGTGPSDHTSFYRKDIPVLFYFTGLHTDYHKPSDDEPKINYNGMRLIISHLMKVIAGMDDKGKIAFTKTREQQTTTSTRFSVSLGVMPDYTYSGTGMRIDGVTPGRPAEKAGLKAGDIILKIGNHEVNNMETYMQALGKFKKGDRTMVSYKRGEEVREVAVEF